MRLTTKERVLLYLLDLSSSAETVEASPERTQEGIAQGSWIDHRHVPQYVHPLVSEGLVRERQAHVKGIRQRRKVYDLTDSGRLEAVRLRGAVKAETVRVRDTSGVREATVSQVLQEARGTRSLLEIARQSIEAGVVDLSTFVPVAGTATVTILPDALHCEREYDWSGAADLYNAGLASTAGDDVHKLGALYERRGYALHRAALQASQPEAFRARTQEALESCGEALEAYEKCGNSRSPARVARCRAVSAYLGFWLASATVEKKETLDKAWDATKTALIGFDEANDAPEFALTYCWLSLIPILRFYMEWDARSQEPTLRDSIRFGERAITHLTALADADQLASAYVATARDLKVLSIFLAPPNERDELDARAEEYWRKARETSEERAMLGLVLCRGFMGDGTDETLAVTNKALGYARKSKDRLAMGWLLRSLAVQSYWKSLATEDLDRWKELLGAALEASDAAKREYAQIDFVDVRGGIFSVESARAECDYLLSTRELDRRRKYELLEKSLVAAKEACKRAADLGYPDPLDNALGVCVSALVDKANMEQKSEARRVELEDALERINQMDRIQEQRNPSLHFNRGSTKMARAYARSELAFLVHDPGSRVEMLVQAIQDERSGLDLMILDMPLYEREGEVSSFGQLGIDQSKCADMYGRLFEYTQDPEHLRQAAKMLDRAAESFRRPDLPSRIAECHWKAAKVHDALEEHLKAAEEFSVASRTYKKASETVPQLGAFYQDLALYMQAWTEIEKARHHHAREEYAEARDYYERAATLHGISRKWSFMSPNYAAWAQLEGAEGLSRAEKGPEAVAAFERASALFREARVSLKGALGNLGDLDEQRMVEALVDAAERRWRYTTARVALEEARILDKNGEQASSSRRYGLAADGFEKLAADATSDRDRKDLSLIATLAKAWEAMAKAEAEASPELYAEAAWFFEAARELSPSGKAKALARGHSRFCSALEAGTRFADDRDPVSYTAAIKHLDSAAGYYARANAVTASEYARASKLLFDAYAAMDQAAQETDHEEKAKAYLAVERILETCVAAFGRADHSGKRDQALHLLECMKQERELAVSLMKIFCAPLAVSSTAAFATPAPSYEQAVGIGRLEHADIRATLIPAAKALSVGKEVDLMLEIVNAGRAAGQLIKVEELIPDDFELMSTPEFYAIEEHSLNLNGKRIEPLKTEQVRVVLRPMAKGVFTLKPRILYLDDSGNYKSHEPEPIEVSVVG